MLVLHAFYQFYIQTIPPQSLPSAYLKQRCNQTWRNMSIIVLHLWCINPSAELLSAMAFRFPPILKTIKHKNSLWLSEIQDPCHQPQPNCNDFWIMILDERFLREKRVGVALPSIEPNLAQICSRLWQLGSDFLQIGGSFFFCFISTRAHNKIVTLRICFKYLRKGLLYIMINQSS